MNFHYNARYMNMTDLRNVFNYDGFKAYVKL